LHTEAEIADQLPGGILWRKAEEPFREPDYIPLFLTAEADKVLINLHARCSVIMERTAHHAAWADMESVMLGGLPGGNSSLDFFK
jgi:hypothetical protein